MGFERSPQEIDTPGVSATNFFRLWPKFPWWGNKKRNGLTPRRPGKKRRETRPSIDD